MIDRAERVKELESSLVERMFEILSSIKVVKSFAREPYELRRFETAGAEPVAHFVFDMVVESVTVQ